MKAQNMSVVFEGETKKNSRSVSIDNDTKVKNTMSSVFEQEARAKRLARIDMHTLLEGSWKALKNCTQLELRTIVLDKRASSQIKVQAAKLTNADTAKSILSIAPGISADLKNELQLRLDPEDQDTTEV